MTTARSVTSSVAVGVDPATAFAVFTDELDCWWVQGPINFYDSSRAYGVRMEPGVGGRIVEVYDDAGGDGLELARITVWEPGSRLGWRSSLDDVEVDVRFEADGTGTRVSVQATIPPGGRDEGGTAWVRMTPIWLGDWIARREGVPHEPLRLGRLAVGVHYTKPATAARWLCDVFGFEPVANIPETDNGGEHTWLELRVGDSSVYVFEQSGRVGLDAPVTHTPWVFVDDLDAHFARSSTRGARVVQGIWHHGVRAYEVADLEGRRWTFAQASPLMRRAATRGSPPRAT